MAVTKVSDYAIGDASLNDLMTTTDDQRYGYTSVALTEWTTTTAPQVAAGSRFECNGALYKVTTDTVVTGSPTGKTFIQFDVSELGFIFTNTNPTWDDDKQGFYGTGGSANDVYLPFVMDVSGATYSDKRRMVNNKEMDRLTLEDGANADRYMFFASDASIFWDESEDKFVINKDIDVQTIYRNGPLEAHQLGFFNESNDEDAVYSFFVNNGLEDGKNINIWGGFGATDATSQPVLYAYRSGTTVSVYDFNLNNYDFVSGNTTKLDDVFGTSGIGTLVFNVMT